MKPRMTVRAATARRHRDGSYQVIFRHTNGRTGVCLVDPKAGRNTAYLRSLVQFMHWKLSLGEGLHL